MLTSFCFAPKPYNERGCVPRCIVDAVGDVCEHKTRDAPSWARHRLSPFTLNFPTVPRTSTWRLAKLLKILYHKSDADFTATTFETQIVTCNLRCSIATSDAPMHHLTLQTDRHDSAISRRILRFQARSPPSRPEKPIFGQSSAMRTQASVLDLQLQMDTLPRGPCHGFVIDALSRTLRPVSRHHVRSGT